MRELTERLALLEREKVELEMRASALAGGAAVPAGLLVRWEPGPVWHSHCSAACVCTPIWQTQDLVASYS